MSAIPTFQDELKKWQLSVERTQLKARVEDLLEQIERDGLVEFMGDLNKPQANGLTFYDDPASAKFHNNSLGGLVRHSLTVCENFRGLIERNGLSIPYDSMIICGLFHDMCKWGTYKPNVTEIKVDKDGKYKAGGCLHQTIPFKIDDDCYLGHAEESIIKLQKYITLTPLEMKLIRWHMGPFEKAYWDHQPKINNIEKWLFLADYEATLTEGSEE